MKKKCKEMLDRSISRILEVEPEFVEFEYLSCYGKIGLALDLELITITQYSAYLEILYSVRAER